ncbi:MAG: exo-alpha-sialidase [Wenzhouxiangellaceae bacterium]
MRLSTKTIVALSAVIAAGCGTLQQTGPSPMTPAGGQEAMPADPAGGKVPGGGDYWATRYTYPTFQFDQRWLTAAKRQHDRMQVASPKGERLSFTRGDDTLPIGQFTLLGPMPLGSGAGANAGRINAVLSDPLDPTIAYIGSDGGGVWKTTNCCDANTTWTVLTDDPQFNSIAIGTLHMDPDDNNIIYAGTGDLRYGSFSFGSAGLLRTKDAGATWEILGADEFGPALPQAPGVFPQYQSIGQVQVDPRDSETIIVGTKTGLFISYNDGADWTGPCLTNNFTSQRQDITGLLTLDNGVATELMVAVGTRGGPTAVQPDLDQNGANGIYEGTLPASGCPTNFQLISRADNGWPAGTGAGVANGPLGRVELARAPTNPDIIYAEAVDPNSLSFLGVWRSNDGGVSWTQTATPGNLSGCTIGGQSWYYAGILVSPTDPDQLFMNGLNKFRSVDGGNTFQGATCNDPIHVDHHATAYVNNDPSQLLAGSDGGIYYTANANEANVNNIVYTQMNDTLPTIEFYSGDITANFAISSSRGATGGAQDNGSSVVTWNGPVSATNWTRVFGGDGIYARIEPVLGQRWYVESQNGNMGVSQNGPNGPYNTFGRPWSADTLSFLFPFEIYKHDCSLVDGCEHLIAGSNRVWESITGGFTFGSWYPNSPDLSKGTLGNRSFINQLAFSFTDESIVIAGTNDGNVWYGFNMGQGTADTGAWVNVTDGNAVLPNRPILDVVTDALNPTVGYAAVGGFDENTPTTPGHLFRVDCNNDCSSFTWTDKSGNLPNIPVNSVMVNPNNPTQVFAGSDWGVYFTDDINAASPVWMRFTAGLPSAMVWDMAVDRGFTTLAVFTRSRGAYAWPLTLGPEEILIDGFEDLP